MKGIMHQEASTKFLGMCNGYGISVVMKHLICIVQGSLQGLNVTPPAEGGVSAK